MKERKILHYYCAELEKTDEEHILNFLTTDFGTKGKDEMKNQD